jgi:hypothetical protein
MKKYIEGAILLSRYNKVKWVVMKYLKKEDVYIMKTADGAMRNRVSGTLMDRYFIV